jgi:hypothetical protein
MAVQTLLTTMHTDEHGVRFEVYSHRELTPAEISQEIALYIAARRRKPEAGKTYRVFTRTEAPDWM